MAGFYQFARQLGTRLGLARHGIREVAVRRFEANPIIRPAMLPGEDGDNINGPSLIAAPDWLPGRLGRYYLYFAHHHGQYIRLAFADRLEGPWRVFIPGTLAASETGATVTHVASPDVHVDEARRRIVMYFHLAIRGQPRQVTHVAYSDNGIDFTPEPGVLADFYLRVVPRRGRWVGMSKGGVMYLQDGIGMPLQALPAPAFDMPKAGHNAPGTVRHVALIARDDALCVYFSRIGDAPERILRATIDLSAKPERWRAGRATEVIRPQATWEGADLPVEPSAAGAARGRRNQLRDPAIFREDGRTYLLYAVAGESGIAIAEIED